MTANELALLTTIVSLAPMLYFFVASPTFLLRPLSDPIVTRLLRGFFSVHFGLVGVTCGLAALAFLLAGRPLFGVGIAAVAVLAAVMRAWFVSSMDLRLEEHARGDGTALRHLRRLHWGGMAYNAAQLAAIVGSIPRIFPTGV